MTGPEASGILRTQMTNYSALPRTVTAVRMGTAVLFLLFGEYKIAGPGFAHGGFQSYLHDYISNTAVGFYRPVLTQLVAPHAVFFGYAVGAVELLIGTCLLLGLWVRPACIAGVLFLINMVLATWWGPGHGAPIWQYFGAELDHIPLALLLILLYAADAGRAWGLDGTIWNRK